MGLGKIVLVPVRMFQVQCSHPVFPGPFPMLCPFPHLSRRKLVHSGLLQYPPPQPVAELPGLHPTFHFTISPATSFPGGALYLSLVLIFPLSSRANAACLSPVSTSIRDQDEVFPCGAPVGHPLLVLQTPARPLGPNDFPTPPNPPPNKQKQGGVKPPNMK